MFSREKREPNAAAGLVMLAALGVSGCITTQQLPPAELPRLDGYPAMAPVPIQTLQGEKTAMTASSRLSLDLPDGRVGGKFSSIAVRDGVFRGQTTDGRIVTAPVARIRSAQLSRQNVPGTIVVVVFASLAGVALGTALWGFFLGGTHVGAR
jgi:hypothetical protein